MTAWRPFPSPPGAFGGYAITGDSGSGKSTAVAAWRRSYAISRWAVLVFGTVGEFSPVVGPGRIARMRWGPRDVRELARQAESVIDRCMRSPFPIVLCMEECGGYARLSPTFSTLTAYVRHTRCILLWIAQRPVYLTPDIRTQCQEIISWRVPRIDARKLSEEFGFDPDRLSALPPGAWARYSKRGSVITYSE